MAMNSMQEKFCKSEHGEDEYLIWDSFKSGDKSAYAYFYNEYSSLLYRYGCKIVSDRELVKDCMHDLFTEIWKNKANLSHPASIKNYLVKSLRNKLVREISKQSRFVQEGLLAEKDLGCVDSNELDMVSKKQNTRMKESLLMH